MPHPLNSHGLPVRGRAPDRLARLLDLLQHGGKLERRLGDHVRGLVLERYVVRLDACAGSSVSESHAQQGASSEQRATKFGFGCLNRRWVVMW